tara:strand:+ start:128 stop:1354 length:1227 start_codon:yes stop_codon:yes gene_type:complete
MPTFQFQRLNPSFQSDPRRILGQTLMGQGASTAPVRTPLQGLGRLSSALVGAYLQRNALDAQAQREAQATEALMGALPENVSPQIRAMVQAAPGTFEPALMSALLQPTTTSSVVDQGDMAFVQNTTTTPLTGAQSTNIGSLVQRRAAPETFSALTDQQAKEAGLDTSRGQKYQRSNRSNKITQIGGTAPTTNINVDMAKESGKGLLKKFDTLEEAATASTTALSRVDQMLGLLDEIDTGFGAETALTFQRIGQFFNPDFDLKDVAGKEQFLSAANELVLPRVKQLGYNPTDADLRFISQASPRLSNSTAGNKLLLQAIRISEARNVALFREANRFIRSNPQIMEDPTGRFKLGEHLLEFQQTNPLFTESANALKAEFERLTGTSAASVTADDPIADLVNMGLMEAPGQ